MYIYILKFPKSIYNYAEKSIHYNLHNPRSPAPKMKVQVLFLLLRHFLQTLGSCFVFIFKSSRHLIGIWGVWTPLFISSN